MFNLSSVSNKMAPKTEEYVSSLGFKVHKSRGDHFRGISGDVWLQEKGQHDGAEGLWRIHDDLYDLTDFVEKHPGGSMWLSLTKGTDITEAFEAHHISLGPEKLLPKFHVRKALTPRNSPFTFDDNGFYKTLKKYVRDELKKVPSFAATKSKIIADLLFAGFITFAILSSIYLSYYLATLAGIFLCMVTIAAHNFFHQRDQFRMYYFDFSGNSSREWRISHVLSHHLYTNTIIDLEIQFCEPLLQFLPVKKHWAVRYGSWIYFPLFYVSLFGLNFFKRIYFTIEALIKGNTEEIENTIIIPLLTPLLMYKIGGQPLLDVLLLWFYIISVASFQFACIGFNAAHHTPDIFHDGDKTRGEKIDWGISQLDTVMDRSDITGSHFLVLTNFGDHGLHHLFPTVDHGKLDYLYPVFKNVCNMFNVELRMDSQLKMIKNTFCQLARINPNPLPPGRKAQ